MANFKSEDKFKHNFKYIDKLVEKIENNELIRINNSDVSISNTFDITLLKMIINENYTEQYKKEFIDYVLSKKIFKSDNLNYKFTDIDKSQFTSNNASGKYFSSATELATIQSIKNYQLDKNNYIPDINNLNKLSKSHNLDFEFDESSYDKWYNTFLRTPILLDKFLDNINDFEIIGVDCDDSEICDIYLNISKKFNLSKDTWNPADIVCIRKNKKSYILDNLNLLLQNSSLQQINSFLYILHRDLDLVSVSLKKINPNSDGEYRVFNQPNQIDLDYEFELLDLPCDFEVSDNKDSIFKTQEIGGFSLKFKNYQDRYLRFQCRLFPASKVGITQIEITTDGKQTDGRLGKVSVNIIDNLYQNYNLTRINSIKKYHNFDFNQFTLDDIKEFYNYYLNVSELNQSRQTAPSSSINTTTKLNFDEFCNLFELAKSNSDNTIRLCAKLQGLKFCYLISLMYKDNNINLLGNSLYKTANKVTDKSACYLKIY